MWKQVKRAIRRLPGVRCIDLERERARFLVHPHSNAGVFRSFEETRAWLPKSREFDAAELADHYLTVRTQRIFEYDYPVMFWLATAISSGARRILDIGGSVGVHYIAYRRVMTYPLDLTWTVAEVPSMARIGGELARQRELSGLRFIDSSEMAPLEADVWLSAGAIHYFEQQPEEILACASRRPRHIILNKLPLYDGEPFVTAQNLDKGLFAPHHVYNRMQLVSSIASMGYALVDEWSVSERDLYLLGRPEKSFPQYSGLYFIATA